MTMVKSSSALEGLEFGNPGTDFVLNLTGLLICGEAASLGEAVATLPETLFAGLA